MENRTSRGEPERVGEIILRCIARAQEKGFYRPQRPFQHKQRRGKQAEKQAQLAFKFSEPVRDFERPLVDLIPEAYR